MYLSNQVKPIVSVTPDLKNDQVALNKMLSRNSMTAQGSRAKPEFRSNTQMKDADVSTNYSNNRGSDVYEMQQKVL